MTATTIYEHCLKLAAQSPDLKLKVGAMLIYGTPEELTLRDARYNEGGVMGEGFNRPVAGYDCAECPRFLDRTIKSGTQLERCFAIHAEQVAVMDALRSEDDWSSDGYTFLPHGGYSIVMHVAATFPDGSPLLLPEPIFSCSLCSRMMAAAGVTHVVVYTTSGPAILTMAEALKTSFCLA